MERNPVWVIPALLALSAVGGAVGYGMLTSGPSEPTAEQRDAAQRAAVTERLRAQMALDSFTPVLMAAIPLMVAGGAFFMWKSRQEEAA